MDKSAQPSVFRTARYLVYLILLVLLVAVAIGLWQRTDEQESMTASERLLSWYLPDTDIFNQRTHNVLAELGAGQEETEQWLDQLATSLFAVERHVLSTDIVDDFAVSILTTVEHFIVAADRYLQRTGDIHSALVWLKYAENLLQSSEILRATDLAEKLNQDIAQLDTQTTTDTPDIYQQITRVVALIDALPPATENRLAAIELADDEQENSASSDLWWRYLHEIRQDLGQLIRIEKTINPDEPLLSPTQESLLKENLRAQLTLARLALMVRDKRDYRTAVKIAADWMNRYYDKKIQPAEEMLEILYQLTEADIGSQWPDFEETLSILQQNKLRLKGEDE